MIHIIQCLCPARHCIVGLAYDSTEFFLDDVMAAFKRRVATAIQIGMINPWCGICLSRVWHYEDSATKYATLEDAAQHLARLQESNALARRLFGQGNQN
jgi:hypothetical protein